MAYEPVLAYTYEPPHVDLDEKVLVAVAKVGIQVDKAELLKALEYDRNQYEKGYNDAIKDMQRKLSRMEKK